VGQVLLQKNVKSENDTVVDDEFTIIFLKYIFVTRLKFSFKNNDLLSTQLEMSRTYSHGQIFSKRHPAQFV